MDHPLPLTRNSSICSGRKITLSAQAKSIVILVSSALPVSFPLTHEGAGLVVALLRMKDQLRFALQLPTTLYPYWVRSDSDNNTTNFKAEAVQDEAKAILEAHPVELTEKARGLLTKLAEDKDKQQLLKDMEPVWKKLFGYKPAKGDKQDLQYRVEFYFAAGNLYWKEAIPQKSK